MSLTALFTTAANVGMASISWASNSAPQIVMSASGIAARARTSTTCWVSAL